MADHGNEEENNVVAAQTVTSEGAPEFSIVMPCLNEAETIGTCIQKAQEFLHQYKVVGEIVVADNGSTDGSQEIATLMGARVVHVKAKGYGNALMGGITAARGRYVIMGDADDSYDFLDLSRFVERLRAGHDLVMGCRLPWGGGTIKPGAMPFLHRWWGNPMFTVMARRWFGAPINDVYCGLRGFSKALFQRLNLRCTGMEFATEMIIKSSLYREKIAEVPITLHPDGRTTHPPHLKTYRDGWRTLRFFLMYSPRWLFVIPGTILIFLGMLGYAVAMPGLRIHGVTFDAHTLLFASLAILCGYQAVLFAIFSKTFAVSEGLMPEDPKLAQFFKIMYLERGLILSGAGLLLGLGLLLAAVQDWRLADFGQLDYAKTMRLVVPGATITALSFQTILSSFFVSILGMRRR
ncbi:MAG: dolichol-P-glucose synthetase [Nitrospira sp. WS110]|nr:dolichol-P-glucose synthetase [Nitrospira sp. WS110]